MLKNGKSDDTHREDSLGLQPLFSACAVGNYEIVHALLEEGADIDFLSQEDNVTALYAAAERGHVDIVEYLLGKNANINHVSEKRGSVL